MANLAQDMIEEILSRLPAKCLIKFKCVSKQWLYLITSHRFIKLHAKQYSGINGGESRHIFVKSALVPGWDSFNQPSYFYNAFYLDDDKPISMNDLVSTEGGAMRRLYLPPLNEEEDYLYDDHGLVFRFENIVGSCDGLLCMALAKPTEDMAFVVWNPCTREHWEWPSPAPHNGRLVYAFGYTSSSDDYKLIFGGSCDVKVLSLKTNSWHSIKNINGPSSLDCAGLCPFQRNGALVKGAAHWTLMRHRRKYSTSTETIFVIRALDLEEEKITELPLPDCIKHLFYPSVVLGGYLSVVQCSDDRVVVTVWSMKEYGVGSSWTKVASISDQSLSKEPNLDETEYCRILLLHYQFKTFFDHLSYHETLLSPMSLWLNWHPCPRPPKRSLAQPLPMYLAIRELRKKGPLTLKYSKSQ